MLTRMRWFVYGVAATLLGAAVVIGKARTMRERLDAHGVAVVSGSLAADTLEKIGRRLQRPALRLAPEGSAEQHG